MRFPMLHKAEPVLLPSRSILHQRLAEWLAKMAPQVAELGLKEAAAFRLISAGLSSVPDDALETAAVAVHRELGKILAEHFSDPV